MGRTARGLYRCKALELSHRVISGSANRVSLVGLTPGTLRACLLKRSWASRTAYRLQFGETTVKYRAVLGSLGTLLGVSPTGTLSHLYYLWTVAHRG